jgi:hypothetical protein
VTPSRKSKAAGWIVGAAILVGVLAFAVNENCCEKPDPAVQALLASAERGDLSAIRSLYMRAVADGVGPMVEYWAYNGALGGDREMRSAYVEIFRTRIDEGRQQKVLAALQQKPDQPGAACLLAQLKNDTSWPTQCK